MLLKLRNPIQQISLDLIPSLFPKSVKKCYDLIFGKIFKASEAYAKCGLLIIQGIKILHIRNMLLS